MAIVLFLLLIGSAATLVTHWPAWRVLARIGDSNLAVTISSDENWILTHEKNNDSLLIDTSGVVQRRFVFDEKIGSDGRFSTDSSHVEFATSNGTVNRYQIATGQWFKEKKPYYINEYASETLSDDGQYVLSKPSEANAAFYELLTRKQLKTWSSTDSQFPTIPWMELVPSGDGGSFLLIVGDHQSEIVEIPSFHVKAQIAASGIKRFKISPNRRWIASPIRQTLGYSIAVYDTSDGRMKLKIPQSLEVNGPTYYSFSPDSLEICVVNPIMHFGEVWNIESGANQKLEMSKGTLEPFYGTAYFRGGGVLELLDHSGNLKSVVIWDRKTGKYLFSGEASAISKDSKQIFARRRLFRPPDPLEKATFVEYEAVYFLADPDRILARYETELHRGLHLLARFRPEPWWGIAWLPEFWLTVIVAGAFLWILYCDWKRNRMNLLP